MKKLTSPFLANFLTSVQKWPKKVTYRFNEFKEGMIARSKYWATAYKLKKKREIGKKYTVKCNTFKKINKFMLTADVHYMQFAKTDNYFSHEM